jgi:hypothetical protein
VSQKNPFHVPKPIYLISNLILAPIYFWFYLHLIKTTYLSHQSRMHKMHSTCILPLCHDTNNLWWNIETMKPFTRKICPAPCPFLSREFLAFP